MQIDGRNVQYLLHKPKKLSEKGIILLPGVSGKALTNRYNALADKIKESGFFFLRADFWTSQEDLMSKTLRNLHKIIDQSIDYMQSMGCKDISFIGKSFGGGVLLTHKNSDIHPMVLLAPLVGLNKRSNISEAIDKKLSEFKTLDEIKINKNDLKMIKSNVLIIHGTKDEIVSLSNSKGIVKNLSKGKLEVIKGAGHSYDKEGEMEEVIRLTVGFLRSFM